MAEMNYDSEKQKDLSQTEKDKPGAKGWKREEEKDVSLGDEGGGDKSRFNQSERDEAERKRRNAS